MLKTNIVKKFIKEIGNTTDPVVFLGLAKILKVPVMEEGKPRDFVQVLRETIDNYIAAPYTRQKEILTILKDANKCKEKIKDANNTKNSAKTDSNEKV